MWYGEGKDPERESHCAVDTTKVAAKEAEKQRFGNWENSKFAYANRGEINCPKYPLDFTYLTAVVESIRREGQRDCKQHSRDRVIGQAEERARGLREQ